MKTLAIETSGRFGGVALWDGELLGERLFDQPMNHAQELFPAIAELSARFGWKPDDPQIIAVNVGPGSYTGLRVGVAAAKMLAFAIDAALVGVLSTDALVRNAPADADAAAPIIDAKRKQAYARRYRRGAGEWRPESELTVDDPAAIAANLPPEAVVFGDGAALYADVFRRAGLRVLDDPALAQARPAIVAELGERLFRAGERADIAALLPVYLRKPEAEEKKRS